MYCILQCSSCRVTLSCPRFLWGLLTHSLQHFPLLEGAALWPQLLMTQILHSRVVWAVTPVATALPTSGWPCLQYNPPAANITLSHGSFEKLPDSKSHLEMNIPPLCTERWCGAVRAAGQGPFLLWIHRVPVGCKSSYVHGS